MLLKSNTPIIVKDTPTWQLLLYCCQLTLQKSPDILAKPLNIEGVDWKELLELAQQHRVRPLLYVGLNKLKAIVAIPDFTLRSLKEFNLLCTQKNLSQAKELLTLRNLLKEQQITFVPYKGLLLSLELWGTVNAREFSDMDWLVYEKDFESIQNLLLDKGYQSEIAVPYAFFKKFSFQYCEYNFDFYLNGKRLFHVEPHWYLGPKRYQIALSLDDFMPFVIKKKFLGQYFNTFNPEGLILSVVIHHGGKDRWKSLKLVADLAAILSKYQEEINWENLWYIANKWKIVNLLLLGIALSNTLFGTTIPKQLALEVIKPNIQKQVHVQLALMQNSTSLNLRPTPYNNFTFHFLFRRSFLTKLKVSYYNLLQVIIPTIEDVEGETLDYKNLMLLTLRKPFRLWRTYLKKS